MFNIHALLADVKSFFDVPAVHDFLAALPTVHGGHISWPHITFDHPHMLWAVPAALLALVLYWRMRQPWVAHSRLPVRTGWSARGAITIMLVLVTAGGVGVGTASLLTAMARPEKMEIKPGGIVMVRDLHFFIDNSSGNTAENANSEAHDYGEEAGQLAEFGQCPPGNPRKLEVEIYAACRIARAFPSDRKSLATFSGATQCCTPAVTTDERFFEEKLRYLNQWFGDNGTDFDDQNGVFSVGLDFIQSKGKSATQVMFVFTDGDGTMTDDGIAFFAHQIRSRHILLICGGPGPDTVATDPESDAIVKLCKQSNGLIVNLAEESGIQQAIDAVKALPPSSVTLDGMESKRPLHEAFVLLAALALGLAALSAAALGRIR